MNNKISVLVILLVLGAIAWMFWPQFSGVFGMNKAGTDEVACTADAMQCPDGSWVGRTGPQCEFVCLGA